MGESMSTFGPFYPRRLQELVNHAERMARVLKVEERGARRGGLRDAWIAGRAGEVERFVEVVAAEWREGRRSVASVEKAVSAYLESLHDGMVMHLGDRGFDCCLAGLDTTTAPLPGAPADLGPSPGRSPEAHLANPGLNRPRL